MVLLVVGYVWVVVVCFGGEYVVYVGCMEVVGCIGVQQQCIDWVEFQIGVLCGFVDVIVGGVVLVVLVGYSGGQMFQEWQLKFYVGCVMVVFIVSGNIGVGVLEFIGCQVWIGMVVVVLVVCFDYCCQCGLVIGQGEQFVVDIDVGGLQLGCIVVFLGI